MRIRPIAELRGTIELPGDKSISHRAALISALAHGTSRIQNFSGAGDCQATLDCLRSLGVSIEVEQNGKVVSVKGQGREALKAPATTLNCRNSGSTMRILAGVLASLDFRSELTGDSSLSARPMKRIIEPLERMGARIVSADGHAPLTISGKSPLSPIRYRMEIPSAQVKSSVLFAGLGAKGETEVLEEAALQSRDHTERIFEHFGVPIEIDSARDNMKRIRLSGLGPVESRDVRIPGDVSSAAFLIAAAVMLEGSRLKVVNVGVNPTRTTFLDVLHDFGANVTVEQTDEWANESVGTVVVEGAGELKPRIANATNIGKHLVPRLIDELPVLAVLGTKVNGGIVVRGAAELRYKESDRISVLVQNLRAMGAPVKEHDDGFSVDGPVRLSGATLNPNGDHRIAMALVVAALTADGESQLQDPECVRVSFPEFFNLLDSISS